MLDQGLVIEIELCLFRGRMKTLFMIGVDTGSTLLQTVRYSLERGVLMVKQQSWRILVACLVIFGLGIFARPQQGWADSSAGFDSNNFSSFYFIHATDPHLTEEAKITQFKWVGDWANFLKVPFVLLGGDMSNVVLLGDWTGYDMCVGSFQMPLKPIPGNHDVYSTQSLARYNEHFGNDYYSFVYNNCVFVCIDSETLIDPATYPVETQAQWAWFAKTLSDARAAGRNRVFILTHHPPYESAETEPDGYWNMPQAVRAQLLTLARANGVDAIFAGHIHMTIPRPGSSPPLYILGGSAFVFDGQGLGFNVCRVTKKGMQVIYVPLLGPADTTPPSTPQPLSFVARTSSTVTLDWPPATDNVAVLRYNVLRDGAPLTTTLDEGFTDTGLAPCETHRYSITAVDIAGNVSAPSNTVATLTGVSGAQDLIMPVTAWRYLDGGAPAGSLWMLPQFNDSRWPVGLAKLGFGLDDIVTTISLGFAFDPEGFQESLPGFDSAPRPSLLTAPQPASLTAYFRRSFMLPQDLFSYPALTLKFQSLDGAVVYLNGFEIGRWNMPGGAVDAQTPALGAVAPAQANTWHELPLPFNLLHQGSNTLAVEVHLASPASPAMGFNVQLMYSSLTTTAQLTRRPYIQDAATSAVTLRWRTDLPAPSRVMWQIDSAGPATGQLTDLTPVTEHELRLTELAPGTRYYYGVAAGELEPLDGGDGATWFTTNPPVGAEKATRIWVLGDSGTGDGNATAVRDAAATLTATRPADLWLMLGDNAYPSGTEADFQRTLFNIYPATLRQACLWPTIGNHDTYTWLPGGAGHPFYADFTMPMRGEGGGVASGSEAYYAFDYGNIHFICLDSCENDLTTGGPMLTWLKKDLAATQSRWLIAYWHHPPYSKGAHDSDSPDNEGWKQIAMRQNALPILEAAGVDLVLCGHSHSYERSYLLNGHYGDSTTLQPSMILDHGDGREGGSGPYVKPPDRTPNGGTVYAVVGSSGQYTGPLGHHPVMCAWLPAETVGLAHALGSMMIDVRGVRLDAQFIDATGAVQDAFTIWKRLPQQNAVRSWGVYR